MKELLLLRHGKSDWDAAYGGDHERPLNSRGRRAAGSLGRFLARTDRLPDLVVSSTALRARTTAELAIQASGLEVPIRLDEALYGATVAELLAVAARTAPTVDRLLLAGHEPTSSATTAHLTGARVPFPTAALAAIALDIEDWADVTDARGELLFYLPPKLVAPLLDS